MLNLRWRDIGDDALNLPDGKTALSAGPPGRISRRCPASAVSIRSYFCATSKVGARTALSLASGPFARIAGLGRLRLHDLRHTAASHAVMSGENLPLAGKLLGHTRHRTTSGYAHLADGHLVEAAERVGSIIAKAMNLALFIGTRLS